MAEVYNMGPVYVFIGDPTTASGVDMTYLGATRGDVTVNPGINLATARSDQSGMTPLYDTVYNPGPQPVAKVPLIDEEKAKLEAYMVNATQTTDSISFGTDIGKIAAADVPTLCLLPIADKNVGTNGIDSPNAIWFPRAIANDIGQFTFNLPEGEDSFNPRDTQFTSLYAEEDQGGTSIPSDARAGFIGKPADYSLSSWTLPSV